MLKFILFFNVLRDCISVIRLWIFWLRPRAKFKMCVCNWIYVTIKDSFLPKCQLRLSCIHLKNLLLCECKKLVHSDVWEADLSVDFETVPYFSLNIKNHKILVHWVWSQSYFILMKEILHLKQQQKGTLNTNHHLFQNNETADNDLLHS